MKKLFFALITLFIFVATAWGQCTETIFASHQMASTGGSTDTYEYNFIAGRKVKELTLYLQRNSWAGIGPFKIYELGTGSKIYDKRPTDSNSGDYITLTISENATGIKFSNEMTCKANLWNVVIIYRPWIEIPTNDVNFGIVEKGATSQRSISIPHSALESNITASTGTSFFTFSNPVVKSGTCGPTTLNITFKPNAVGAYSDVITFSNGTKVNVYGEYSKRVCTNLEVAKISYTSVLLKWNKVEDADLSGFQIINQATGAIYYADKDDTSLNVTGLEMGKSYSFVIFPLLNDARSLCASNIVTITTNKTDKIKECLVYTSVGKDNNEQNLIASDAIDNLISYDIKSGNSNSLRYTKRVTFEVKWGNWALIEPSMGARGDMCMYVKVEGESGFREEKYWSAANVSLTKEYQKFSALIPHNTVAIEFRTGLSNGASYRYVKNLQVYKDYIIETETPISELNFGEVEPNVSVSKSFKITYAHDIVLSEIAYDNAMKTIIGDGFGFYKVEYADNDDCAEGTQTVTVTFTPTNCAKEYNATLTLINGAVLEIPLKGELKTNPGTVNEITWTGAVDTNWDNRANWKKADGNVLSVADVLDANLKVNIPGGLEQYPVIPDVSTTKAFKEDRDKACDCAQVNAGDNASATMIAKTIVLEYGAALVGVETLYNPETGIRRYHEVENRFDARRKEWLLVGTVVKPWDESGNGEVRNILSKDYYLNGLPHVYMREAVVDENNDVTWKKTFSELDKEVPHNKAFAIYIINEYGPNSWTAKKYDKEYGTSYAETLTMPNTYTYTGHFFNESSVIKYEDLTPLKPAILCNTYPAPIDAYALNEDVDGTIQYYDYTSKSFKSATEGAVIMPQNGFVFTPNQDATSITIDAKHMKSTAIKNRSVAVEPTLCRIKANNAARSVSSEISIRYDEYKEEGADFGVDAPKLFAKETASLPDIYVMRYGANWAGITISDMTQPIPLGVTINSANQTFTIEMTDNNMPYNMVLEDRTTATLYNLSAGEVCTVSDLAKGDCKGRFYLYALPVETDDDDVTTDIDVNAAANGNIDIFTQDNSVIVSATNQTQLKSIVVSDMMGRSTTYAVNGQYYQITMPNAHGIYLITVIGDAGTVTQKVRM